MQLNCHAPLMKLGRLAEAKAVLERCLTVFQRVEDAPAQASALNALAQVWNALGDPAHAIALERRTLTLRECLYNPVDRANSHECLASYLNAVGALAEAKVHQLASLTYSIVTGFEQHGRLHNLANRIRESAARGETFAFPPLADLLALPAFAPLRTFLAERSIPTAALQTRIDDLVARVRTAAPPPAPQF
jgi:tetratricopeptide (TPR) repeat protein